MRAIRIAQEWPLDGFTRVFIFCILKKRIISYQNTNASYGYDVMSGGDFQFISAYLGDRDFIQKRSLKRSFKCTLFLCFFLLSLGVFCG